LRLPPLRERSEDIAPLLEHFLTALAKKTGRPRKRFSPEALNRLVHARLPGNVRQLQNIVEQCVVLSSSDLIPLSLTTEALREQPGDILPLDEAKLAFERRYLASLLRTTDGKVANAAKLAGRNRTEFYKLLARHELDAAAFRSSAREKSSSDDS
jgi:two-component system response regulator GlrR